MLTLERPRPGPVGSHRSGCGPTHAPSNFRSTFPFTRWNKVHPPSLDLRRQLQLFACADRTGKTIRAALLAGLRRRELADALQGGATRRLGNCA